MRLEGAGDNGGRAVAGSAGWTRGVRIRPGTHAHPSSPRVPVALRPQVRAMPMPGVLGIAEICARYLHDLGATARERQRRDMDQSYFQPPRAHRAHRVERRRRLSCRHRPLPYVRYSSWTIFSGGRSQLSGTIASGQSHAVHVLESTPQVSGADSDCRGLAIRLKLRTSRRIETMQQGIPMKCQLVVPLASAIDQQQFGCFGAPSGDDLLLQAPNLFALEKRTYRPIQDHDQNTGTSR